MVVKDWMILKTIYEERNITKAAERLYISQPALTYRLKHLEKEFGTQIVIRGKKGVEFTSEGEYLVNYAKNMIVELRRTKELIHNMSGNVKGTLRLGVSSNFGRYKLPSILKDFLEMYPEIEIKVTTKLSTEILNLVHKGDIHIGIIRGDYDWYEHKHLLYQEYIYIVSKQKISIDQLTYLQRIDYKTDPLLETLIEHWWKERFTKPPHITMEVDKMETCKEMVKNKLGYAILPSLSLTDDHDLSKIKLRKKNGEEILRKTWMISRNASIELSVARAFINFLRENPY
jgi:DNA-binding transcriptional LysR family regulator